MHRRAALRQRLRPDAAAHRLDQAARHEKANARATRDGARAGAPVEQLEQLCRVFAIKTVAVILDAHGDRVIDLLGVNVDARFGATPIAHRVRQEVAHYLFDIGCIAAHGGQARRQVKVDVRTAPARG